jgi:hypothetical protein
MCYIFLCTVLAGVQKDRPPALNKDIPGTFTGKEACNDKAQCNSSKGFREEEY